MKKVLPLAIFAGCALATSTPTYADELKKFWVGGSIARGVGTLEDTPTGDLDADLWGRSLSAGYAISSKWGVEVSNTVVEDVDFLFNTGDGDFDLSSNRITASYTHLFNKRIFARARLGFEFWEAEGFSSETINIDNIETPWNLYEADEETRFSLDGNDITFGLSLGLTFRPIDISLDYDAIGAKEASINLYSASIRVKF